MKVALCIIFVALALVVVANEQESQSVSQFLQFPQFPGRHNNPSPTKPPGASQKISLSNTKNKSGCLTICQKYSKLGCRGAAGCTPGTFKAELGMVHLFVDAIVAALFKDPITKDFFTGKFNDINFFDPSQSKAKASLFDNQYRFNGGPKGFGCPTFASNGMSDSSVGTMTAIHDWTSNGRKGKKKLNKAAFDAHNRINIDVLASFGLDPVDLYAVAKGLDNFRTGQGDARQKACFDADCNPTSGYVVEVHDTYFNPAYYSVPSNSKITFKNADGNTDNNVLVHGTSLFQCVPANTNNIEFSPDSPATITVGSGNDSIFFYSQASCNTTRLAGRIDIFKSTTQRTPNPEICH